MRHKFNSDVHVQNRWFHVSGWFYPGFAGTYEDPPEPPEIDISKIEQFFDDDEEPWEKDEMFVDEIPDIWLFVEKYYDDFLEAVEIDMQGCWDEGGY